MGTLNRNVGLALLAIAIAATVVILTWRPQHFRAAGIGSSRTGVDQARGSPAEGRSLTTAGHSSRATQLEVLKKRWLAATPVDRTVLDEHFALARESTEQLLCSREMVELITFLEKPPHLGAVMFAFDRAVEGLFAVEDPFDAEASSKAGIARQNVIDLPASSPLRSEWSFYAGKGCTEQELADFRAKLEDPRCSQDAFFGWALKLAKTAPARAFELSVQEFGHGSGSSGFGGPYTDLAKEFPAEADFAALEKLLPPTEKDGVMLVDLDLARRELMRKWAAVDIAAAANYVFENPGRMNPKIMSCVVEGMARDRPAQAAEWIGAFPRGPCFDSAAYVTVNHLCNSDPDKANLLAAQIADPKIRAYAMDAIRRSAQPDSRGK